MMKKVRIISALLTLALLFGSLAVSVAAKTDPKTDAEGVNLIDYITKVYATPEEKLEEMTLYKEQNGFQIWVEDFTLEVAIVNTKTGQILFSNPFDVAGDTGSDTTKQKLLSQLVIKYQDNDTEKTMNSYVEAALRNQGVIKNIKNGVRIEYTMGREETRMLVPRLIQMERFDELILAYVDVEWDYDKLKSYYTLKDPKSADLTERGVKEMQAKFPITNKMAVYVCDPDIKERELRQCENIIKTYCQGYTYETLDEDHAITEYVGADRAPALFKLAIEYTLDDYGVTARLPANGIRYDETNYQLKSITFLPYMGTGSNVNTGYTFIPDGSGSIFRFEDLIGNTYTTTGKVYGADYAYHEISGAHVEVMRLPVYGAVENYTRTDTKTTQVEVTPEGYDEATGSVIPAVMQTLTEKVPYKEDKGFIAIITEGDALAEITSEHGGSLHRYNSVYATFYPRPSDTYNLSDSISIASNATWTVESKRKYVDSYRIRYIMLTDADKAEAAGLKENEYYETSYVGMAKAYRNYLEREGILTRFSTETAPASTPLYIETFGSIKTMERILSIPVSVDTPLTTFEDIMTMYNDLSEAGIDNINFRLTGYANGGMDTTYPTFVKWVNAVGGNSGFKDLIAFAKEKNFGVYPDFDFAYMNDNELFDGFILRRDAIKTIDDRYTRRRYYDAATQSFDNNYALCVSPSAYERLYQNFKKDYDSYNPMGISVSTLGTDLNSDFDEDEPYNREDSKAFTNKFLDNLKTDYTNVMTDGGNEFALKYANNILNVSLDSSRYQNSFSAVPFIGMVFHGYINFAGTPINMEGDVNYMLLKAIENGAGLFFTLSYRNTSELKDSMLLSKYYSVRYDIWFDELVEKYKTLNEATGNLQSSLINEHEFLIGERIPDEDEIAADKAAEELAAKAEEEALALEAEKAEKAKKLAERLGEPVEVIEDTTDETLTEGETDGETPAEGETATGEETTTEDTGYTYTKYTNDNGNIVYVGYENGTGFILNYNSFAVTVVFNGTTYTVEALGFVKIS